VTGVERIAAERKRQVEDKGFDADHDDTHEGDGQLAAAAACYAAPFWVLRSWGMDSRSGAGSYIDPWPPHSCTDHRRTFFRGQDPVFPSDYERRISELEKAGALCAAEIDRLLRLKEKTR
jgi:hypothetical protein